MKRRFERYPLRFARLVSLNTAKRKGYESVELMRDGAGWWLVYDRDPHRQTGSFPTRYGAVAWFARNGR